MLLVRNAVKQITYGKKKISVEWFYNRFSDDKSGDLSVETGATAPAVHNISADSGLPNRVPRFVPATTTFKFETAKLAVIAENNQTIALNFPNLAEKY